jgi:UDP-N-acetylmuramate--alanine ligase
MKLSDVKKVFFLGIGGIGMSALARYFNTHGAVVAGYDKTPTRLTGELSEEGIAITFEDSLETLMNDADLVVYTPAIPANHLQFNYYKNNQFTLVKRSEVLGLIANSMYNICVAGSHGKTSTSSLIGHILHHAGKDVAAFLGGVCINYDSNFINGSTYAVAEADEFDRSFLRLFPDIALVTSVDTDHLDIYGSFEAIKESFKMFLGQLRQNGTIIIQKNVPESILPAQAKVLTYALDDASADFHVTDLKADNGANIFNIVSPLGNINDVHLYYGGRHNVENALGAVAIAQNLGLSPEEIRAALATFKGVRRRFETHFRSNEMVYIDDYAHHPREIDAIIAAARQLYQGKKITVVFQPHLFSRTKDLAEEFAASLDKADEVFLLEIYPARELPIPGVTNDLIFDAMQLNSKHKSSLATLMHQLESSETEVLLTVGAGDIDTMVNDIKNMMSLKAEKI